MHRMLLDLARVSLDLDRIFKCAVFLRLLKGLLSIPSWYIHYFCYFVLRLHARYAGVFYSRTMIPYFYFVFFVFSFCPGL